MLEQTLPGMQLLSGGIKIEKPEEDLHGIYASSRIIIVSWSILFASFIISEDNGFDYRGALLAWVSGGKFVRLAVVIHALSLLCDCFFASCVRQPLGVVV